MALELLPERLWERIQPLLPPEKPAGTRGRPPITNQAGPDRHRLRAAHRLPVEHDPQGAGLRQRVDLLPAVPGLDRAGYLPSISTDSAWRLGDSQGRWSHVYTHILQWPLSVPFKAQKTRTFDAKKLHLNRSVARTCSSPRSSCITRIICRSRRAVLSRNRRLPFSAISSLARSLSR